jgi:hypothetical protein
VGGGGGFFLENKSDFKTISFKKFQKIPGRNSKRTIQNLIKRKMTNDTIRNILLQHVLPVYILAQTHPCFHP